MPSQGLSEMLNVISNNGPDGNKCNNECNWQNRAKARIEFDIVFCFDVNKSQNMYVSFTRY